MPNPAPVQQPSKVTPAYIQWILSANRGIMANLYFFTSVDGVTDYFTDFDADINWSNRTWKSNSLRFEGFGRKIAIGTAVDEQTLKIWAAPTDTLFGSNFLAGAEQGLMDGAVIVRYRLIWYFTTGNTAFDVANNPPIGSWPLYTGYIAAMIKGGTSHVEFKVKSALHKLDVNMPRNYYQPGCLWTLFSPGCTLQAASYKGSGTIATVYTNPPALAISGGISPNVGTDGIANLAQGKLQFTSGSNTGLLTLIASNDANNIYLAYALDQQPAVGDTIIYYPGCSKSYNTCQVKYNNVENFRGFDKVPPVMVSL